MLSLCCYAWVFSSCREWGFLSSSGMQAAHCGASVAAALRLRSTGPTAVAHGLSCCAASGIFLDQGSNSCLLSEGSNSCLLHWQADSLPLSHQGNPRPTGPRPKIWFCKSQGDATAWSYSQLTHRTMQAHTTPSFVLWREKEAIHKRAHNCMIPFAWNARKTNLVSNGREQISGGLRRRARYWPQRVLGNFLEGWKQSISWLWLHGIHICQTLSSCGLNVGSFCCV